MGALNNRGAIPPARQVNATVSGGITVQVQPGPDGKPHLLIVLDLPGSTAAYLLGRDGLLPVREQWKLAIDAVCAGLVTS